MGVDMYCTVPCGRPGYQGAMDLGVLLPGQVAFSVASDIDSTRSTVIEVVPASDSSAVAERFTTRGPTVGSDLLYCTDWKWST